MKDIITRIKLLIIKTISVKGVIFILSTILMFNGLINELLWVATGVLVTSVRMFEKLIDKFKS